MIMKLKGFIFTAVAAVMAFAACEKKQENLGTPSITISESTMTFEVAGGEQTLTLNASRDWEVTGVPAWLSVSPESGKASSAAQTVVVTALANNGGNRNADLKFTIGTLTKTLKVAQAGEGGNVAPEPGEGMTPIADILKLAEGTQFEAGTKIQGVVISNMALNNLTSKKGMYVQDATGALQFYFSADHSFLYGDLVEIDLSGVKKGAYNGAVQVSGLAPTAVTKISSGNTIDAKPVTMADFLANKYEGQYVALEGVQVKAADLSKTWVVNNVHTSINMEDANGNSFVVFSSKYADDNNGYGTQTVPQGSGTIKGISSFNNGTIQIIFTQESDFAGLTGARFDGAVVPPTGGDEGDNEEDDDDNGGQTPPPAGDVTGTTISITKETINNPSWTTNGYGSQVVADLSTYLNWTINGCAFIGCKLCLPLSTNVVAEFDPLQCQGNASDASKQFRLGNTTSLGKIKKITIVSYNEKYTPNFNLAIGTTQQVGTTVPSGMIEASSMTTTQDGMKYTTVYTPTSDAGFFAIYKNTTGALYLKEIVIEYELN